ncbi:MAG TPA: prepilin peptidase [Candidatus Paceibacterota bacterium]|nr:prepilin peptidase [Candidatus Paceibacterota bacterium]
MTILNVLLAGSALLGVIVGSFLNALSFRFNTGVPFLSARGMGGRSRCMQCGHALGGLDLVPVVSYLFLGGKCRYCSSRISVQYPLVELMAGALSAGVFLLNPSPFAFAFWFVVWMTLLFVVMYDTKHMIIPWSCSLLLIALAVVGVLFDLVGRTGTTFGLWTWLAGPLLALPLFLLSLVSWGRWMGWADSLLELSLGALLGVSAGATALMLAFWSGALVGIALLVLSRIFTRLRFFRYTIKSEMPFAPFLVLGAALAYFCHVDFFSSFQLLW